jgi:G3E family GTPase
VTLSRGEERLVEMSNGCICCTLREDLLVEVASLARAGRFDVLVIESTGISEPLPVAETFTFRDETGASLSDLARLDTLVTVVDAVADLESADHLAERGESLGADDHRALSELLIDQVEFADVIVVNKIDLIGSAERERLIHAPGALNRHARIVPAVLGQIPLAEVIDTGRFDFARAADAPGWLAELRGTHRPETEEYGVGSLVYRDRRPFHPRRFHAAITRRVRRRMTKIVNRVKPLHAARSGQLPDLGSRASSASCAPWTAGSS